MGLDLALCLDQGGDIDGAVAAARDVLKQLPDDATALNFLGYLFADHNRDLAEAEHMIRRAVDQEPDNGAYVDSMGWVEFRLGRLADARRLLEQAVQMTHGDPTVREHLGDVYKSLDLTGMARDQYRLALASDSTNVRLRNKLTEVH
jgi:Flp pilus assembly protein TadD